MQGEIDRAATGRLCREPAEGGEPGGEGVTQTLVRTVAEATAGLYSEPSLERTAGNVGPNWRQ
jgi:hypothetical protein